MNFVVSIVIVIISLLLSVRVTKKTNRTEAPLRPYFSREEFSKTCSKYYVNTIR